MNKKTKNIIINIFFSVFIMTFGLTMCFIGVLIVHMGITMKLDEMPKTTGEIESTEVVTSSKNLLALFGLGCLEIKLKSNGEIFETYNVWQSYDALRKSMPKGEKVTIFYSDYTSEPSKHDILQIESNDKVLLHYRSYANGKVLAGLLILCLGLFSLAYLAWILKTTKLSESWKNIEHKKFKTNQKGRY